MPRNILGTSPSSNLLSIPRACIFVSDLRSDDLPVGNWRDMGAVSSAAVSFTTNTIEHYTSCGEQRVRDAEITTEIGAELSLSLDHLLITENQALLHSGKQLEYPTGSLGWETDRVGALFIPTFGSQTEMRAKGALGAHYKIWYDGAGRIFAGSPPSGMTIDPDGAGGGAPYTAPLYEPQQGLYGVDPSRFTIEESLALANNDANNGGAVTYTVAAGDFTVNSAQGTLFVPSNSPLSTYLLLKAAAVGGSDYMAVHLGYTGTGSTVEIPSTIYNVEALASSDKSVAIRFEMQDLTAPGYRKVVEIHKVRLRPTGSVDLVSDGTNFASSELSGTIEKPTWKDGTTFREGFYDIREVKFS